MSVLAGGQRFVTDQPGIRTWHAFSAGAHYDPSNLSFGPVVGCDEHLVEPGAGFDWHAHRGVVIVSWVLSGSLRHEDDGGDDGGAALDVGSGELLVQSTADGIRHRETNGSDASLRFVQLTLLLDLERDVRRAVLPVHIDGVSIDIADADRLGTGDTSRAHRRFAFGGPGAELVVSW